MSVRRSLRSASASIWRTRSRLIAQLLADVAQRLGLAAAEPEAQPQHGLLALGQRRTQRIVEPPSQVGALGRRLEVGRLHVRHEVANRGLAILANRRLQRDRQLGRPQRLLDPCRRAARGTRPPRPSDGSRPSRLASSRCARAMLDRNSPTWTGSRMVRACSATARLDGLTNPPVGVGREAEPLPPVVLVDGPVETEVALLDEVEERQAAADVLPGDRHDQSQVALDQPSARPGTVHGDPLELSPALERQGVVSSRGAPREPPARSRFAGRSRSPPAE